MAGVILKGTGSYLPAKAVTNGDLAKIVETSDEWITERTGIRERRFSEGEPTWFMAREAAQKAIENAGISPEEIGLIIACSVTHDFITPSLACVIQDEIHAENAFCWDLNGACTGFIYALDAAQKYLSSGYVQNVLVVCSETLSKITDFSDRSTCVLFGDGAAAAVLQNGAGKIYASYLKSEGSLGSALLARNFKTKSPFAVHKDDEKYAKFPGGADLFLQMKGRDVYRFAVRAFPEALESACARAGLEIAALDLIVPHQANLRIIQSAAEKMGVPMEKFYVNIDRFANTSCASIPICLAELSAAGRLRPGMKIGLAGFGAGLTFGAVVMEL